MSEIKPIIRVRDVMSAPILSIDGMATVKNAIDLMDKSGVSSVVVDRRDEDDEYGILVISDIAEKVIAANRPTTRVNVYEIMSKPVLKVHADMNIKHTIRLLVKFGLARVLVVDSGRSPLGLVTLRDMVIRMS